MLAGSSEEEDEILLSRIINKNQFTRINNNNKQTNNQVQSEFVV